MLNLNELEADPSRIAKLSQRERIALAWRLAVLTTAVTTAAMSDGESNDDDRDITVKEAAAMIAVHETWIYKHKSELPWIHQYGGAVRANLKELRQWMKEQANAR